MTFSSLDAKILVNFGKYWGFEPRKGIFGLKIAFEYDIWPILCVT